MRILSVFLWICFLGYDLIIIFAQSNSVEIELPNYSKQSLNSLHIITNDTLELYFDVNLLDNKISNSYRFCSNLHPGLEFDDSQTKCMIPMIQSLRWNLTNYLSEKLMILGTPFGKQAEMYALLYAYEPSKYHSKGAKDRVCIFGEPYQTTIFPILTSPIVGEIILFTFNESYGLFDFVYQFSRYRNISIIKSMIDQEDSELEAYHSCDIIHFESNYPLSNSSVKTIIDYYAKSTSIPGKTRIVLSQIVSNITNYHVPFTHFIDWKFLNFWPTSSLFTLLKDRNGFTQRQYSFGSELDLTFIRVGEINPLEFQDSSTISVNKPKLNFDRNHLVIFLVTYCRPLIDNLLGYKEALKAIGYKYVQVVNDITLLSYEILEQKAKQTNSIPLQIIIGPSDVCMFSKYYIAFNTEQTWSNIVFNVGARRTFYIFQNAIYIWSFYQNHTKSFQDMGFSDIAINQFYFPNRDFSRLKINPLALPSSDRPLNVFFFGSCSERRAAKLNEFVKLIENHKQEISFSYVCGGWKDLLFDYERDHIINNADVIINISNEDSSTLEVHRLNYLLSIGKVIVSEYGIDKSIAEVYHSAVYFVDDMQELVRIIVEELANNRTNFLNQKIKSLQLFESINRNYTSLELSMNNIQQSLTNLYSN